MQVFAQQIHATGGPEVLAFEPVGLERPGPGEALVRHTAVGVNFIDVYHRSGLYPLPALPHGLGVEAAGVVESVGEGVRTVTPGTRVAWIAARPGTYAEASVVRAERLVPLPGRISEEAAAACLLKGMTAEVLVRRTFRVERGMPVLFHSAAGGVGLLACQWLRHLGAAVIGTVGSPDKVAIARRHGCAHVVVRGETDFVEAVMDVTKGRGVPVAYDAIGRATFDGSLACVARRGTLVAFGNASGKPEPFDPMRLSRGSRYLTRPSLFDYISTREELLASADALFDLVQSGRIRVAIRARWPLEEAGRAQEALESGATTGAAVLVP